LKEKIFKWPQGAKGVKNEVILGIFYFYSFIFFIFKGAPVFVKGGACAMTQMASPRLDYLHQQIEIANFWLKIILDYSSQ